MMEAVLAWLAGIWSGMAEWFAEPLTSNRLLWIAGVSAVVITFGIIGARSGRPRQVTDAQSSTASPTPYIQKDSLIERQRQRRGWVARSLWTLVLLGAVGGAVFWLAPGVTMRVVTEFGVPVAMVLGGAFVYGLGHSGAIERYFGGGRGVEFQVFLLMLSAAGVALYGAWRLLGVWEAL